MEHATYDAPTILIVEANAGPREALKMVLRPFYRVVLAESFDDALEHLQSEHIDLVTLDIKGPDQRGPELIRTIQFDFPDTDMVIITSRGSLGSALLGLAYDRVAGYMMKPFDVKALLALVDGIIGQRRTCPSPVQEEHDALSLAS